jgi:hypothetical protein
VVGVNRFYTKNVSDGLASTVQSQIEYPVKRMAADRAGYRVA